MPLELCRICGNNQNLIKIFEQGPEMLDKLLKCANIEIKSDDILPKLICQQCDKTLEMSYLLRKQSEEMQQRLHDELQKSSSSQVLQQQEEEDDDIQYISDEEFIKQDSDEIIKKSSTNNEPAAMDTGEIQAAEEAPMEQEILDTHSESTLVASETECVEDIEPDYDYHIPSTTIVDAAESNDSYEVHGARIRRLSTNHINFSTNKDVTQTNEPEEILIEDDENENVIVDVCGDNDVNANDANNFLHSDSSSNLLEPCLTINAMSNSGSPTHDFDTDNSRTLPYTCVTCDEVFARKKDYQEHIAQHGANRYQCIQCLASFPTRYRLIRHELIHTDGKMHKCPECNREYRAGYNLQRHIKACHTEKAKFQCNICHLSYARQDVLKRHKDQVHLSKKWHCKLCGKSFRSQFLLTDHKTHSSSCAAAPVSMSSLLSQIKVPNESNMLGPDNKYKCAICNMKFKTIAIYKTHLLIHNNIKPFPCSTCPKSFRTRYALVNHERIHSNEKPFVCDICCKAFRQVTHMKHHRMLKHTNDMPVKCPECQMGFVTKWKLRDHLRKEHCTMKAFKCAECPEEFFLKYDLKRHARLIHLRSVNVADSDNEGVKNGTTFTSDSENYLATETNHGNEGEEHYSDIRALYEADNGDNANTNSEVNEEATQYHNGDNDPTNDERTEEIIDIAEDTDHETAPATGEEVDDDVHIVETDENEMVENNIPVQDSVFQKQPCIQEDVVDNSSSNIFYLNDVDSPPPEPAQIEESLPTSEYPQIISCEPLLDFYRVESPPPAQPSQAPSPASNENIDASSNEPIIDCIQLDSSNSSCQSPPPTTQTCNTSDYIDIEEQEEEIHITEEKIETYTTSTSTYYSRQDIIQS